MAYRWGLRAAGGALLQVAVLWGVMELCPVDANHYIAAAQDKHDRLASLARPRLVIVGGSDAAFGYDSASFLGLGFNPVNMGHSIGFGLSYMTCEVRPRLDPGDVVLVSPAYTLYERKKFGVMRWSLLQYRPASVRCVDAAEIPTVLDEAFIAIARKLRCAAHEIPTEGELVWFRSDFNELGDMVGHRDAKSPAESALDGGPFPPDWERGTAAGIATLREFSEFCGARDVRLIIAFPPIRRSDYRANAPRIEALEQRLRAAGFSLAIHPRDAVFEPSDFVDRGGHLTGEASRRYTDAVKRGIASLLER